MNKPSENKKKAKLIPIMEWFEERKDGVYMIWELPTGVKVERLTPYDKLPYIINKYRPDQAGKP